MGGYRRIFDSINHIDIENENVSKVEVKKGDLDEYLQNLINNVIDAPNNRFFQFESGTTEVHTNISRFIDNYKDETGFQKLSNFLARRLLKKEIEANQQIQRLRKSLKKGSLIISFIELEDGFLLILTKVEHQSYLNTKELLKEIGLPYDKKELRTCIIKFDEDKEIVEIIVTDSNPKLSTYWYKDFLELTELNSDEKNTNIAFKSIEYVISKIKKHSPSDHTILRNTIIGYFKSHETFNFEELIKTLQGYDPENPDKVNMSDIVQELKRLPDKKRFDKTFNIVPEIIKGRIKNIYKISDKIELATLDHIDKLKNVIRSVEKDNGDMVIEIKTENKEVFEAFKYNN
jgi:hypothetical protein